jgi:hypothetical protein
MKLSEQIKEIPALAEQVRVERGLSYREVADAAHVGHTAWFRMSKGRNEMSMKTLIAVTEWLERENVIE